uniref:hypothetical protein n=1 Tax=Amycolatopsis sp. CA-151526 TaxID=3239921 RepID=UPI003F497E8E
MMPTPSTQGSGPEQPTELHPWESDPDAWANAAQEIMRAAGAAGEGPDALHDAAVLAHHLLWQRAGLPRNDDDNIDHATRDLQAIHAAVLPARAALDELARTVGRPRPLPRPVVHTPARRAVDPSAISQVLHDLDDLAETTWLTSRDIHHLTSPENP